VSFMIRIALNGHFILTYFKVRRGSPQCHQHSNGLFILLRASLIH
jgi:hypothetical protein